MFYEKQKNLIACLLTGPKERETSHRREGAVTPSQEDENWSVFFCEALELNPQDFLEGLFRDVVSKYVSSSGMLKRGEMLRLSLVHYSNEIKVLLEDEPCPSVMRAIEDMRGLLNFTQSK